MKKVLFIIIFLISCAALSAQTGTGWTNMRAKYNFRDSININNGWKIGATIVLPSVAEINYLDGVTSAIQTQITARGRVASITATLTAGAETDVTLLGVTAQPYSITIFDANGLNITDAVKDSTAVSGGTYHTYIYSTDAQTGVKIRVLW